MHLAETWGGNSSISGTPYDYQIFTNGQSYTVPYDGFVTVWTQSGQAATNFTLMKNNVTVPLTTAYMTALSYNCGVAFLEVKSGDVLTGTTPTNYYFNLIPIK